jgi:hypothetical protein
VPQGSCVTLVYGLFSGTKQSRRRWQRPSPIFIPSGWPGKGHETLVLK